MKRQELIGKRFARLIVERFSYSNCRGEPHWLCRCDCGKSSVVRASRLKNGRTKSCGCLSKKIAAVRCKSGSGSPAWKGGRGITNGGYITVYAPEHPCATKKGRVCEHRLVMEKMILKRQREFFQVRGCAV